LRPRKEESVLEHAKNKLEEAVMYSDEEEDAGALSDDYSSGKKKKIQKNKSIS
jgi:hypothetical protein